MKKKVKTTILIVLAILLCGFVLCKYVYMFPFAYANSFTLDKETNDEVKELVLNAVKDRCSALYEIDKANIYDLDCKDDIVQLFDVNKGRRIFCFINYGFMFNVTENDGVYEGFVRTFFTDPEYEDCNYHFQIAETEEGLRIVFFGIDP